MNLEDIKRTFLLWVCCSGYIGWVFSEYSFLMALFGVAIIWIVWLALVFIHLMEIKSDKENLLQTAKHLFSSRINS